MEAVMRKKLVVSSKSVLVSSHAALAKNLHNFFKKRYGVELRIDQRAEHLGISRTNGRCTPFAKLKERFARAGKRNSRIKLLARKTPKAKMLFRSGTTPQATYGSKVNGLNNWLQRHLDGMACEAAGVDSRLGCRITACFYKYGLLPSLECLVEFVHNYCQVLQRLSLDDLQEP